MRGDLLRDRGEVGRATGCNLNNSIGDSKREVKEVNEDKGKSAVADHGD